MLKKFTISFPTDDSSSGEETFLVATSREKHKAGKRKDTKTSIIKMQHEID
jgi:hypothetical protein